LTTLSNANLTAESARFTYTDQSVEKMRLLITNDEPPIDTIVKLYAIVWQLELLNMPSRIIDTMLIGASGTTMLDRTTTTAAQTGRVMIDKLYNRQLANGIYWLEARTNDKLTPHTFTSPQSFYFSVNNAESFVELLQPQTEYQTAGTNITVTWALNPNIAYLSTVTMNVELLEDTLGAPKVRANQSAVDMTLLSTNITIPHDVSNIYDRGFSVRLTSQFGVVSSRKFSINSATTSSIASSQQTTTTTTDASTSTASTSTLLSTTPTTSAMTTTIVTPSSTTSTAMRLATTDRSRSSLASTDSQTSATLGTTTTTADTASLHSTTNNATTTMIATNATTTVFTGNLIEAIKLLDLDPSVLFVFLGASILLPLLLVTLCGCFCIRAAQTLAAKEQSKVRKPLFPLSQHAPLQHFDCVF
jgi:hypothetical protein